MQQERERWYSFHFSGKVIMCSVLFGLGLVLIGGLVMAIGKDQNSDSTPNNLDEVQYKAPMVIVGPVLMGIGAITVITGVFMCLFETNICRKRKPDNKLLIEEEANDAETKRSQKREKHRNHKNHKKHTKNSQGNISAENSKPIDVQNSQSFTNSDNFVTPSSSLVSDKASKTLLSSDKSWNTSAEYQTPSSSPLNSIEVDIEQNFDSKFESTTTEINRNGLEIRQNKELHSPDFETPKNSYIDNSEIIQNIALQNSTENASVI